jgi:Ni/Fe-hydrogenase 1 B-type cytochrome subunit
MADITQRGSIGLKEEAHPLICRILHWSWVVLMIIMIFTGFYLHGWMNVALNLDSTLIWDMHLICAVLLLVIVGGRLFYSIISGDWKELMMMPQHLKDLWPVVAYYTFLTRREPQQGKYNVGQRLMYSLIWLALLGAQTLTGILLYFLPGAVWFRIFHFVIAWLFIVTVALHIYLGASYGWRCISSMITGKEWK